MQAKLPDQLPDKSANKVDVGTQLARERTDLAIARTNMADERTLMAWIRTSLSMISFGFAIGKLGQVLDAVEVKGLLGRMRTVSIRDLACFLVVLGTVALLGAAIQYWFRTRNLRAMGFRHRFGLTFIVAMVLVLIGGFALTSLVLSI